MTTPPRSTLTGRPGSGLAEGDGAVWAQAERTDSRRINVVSRTPDRRAALSPGSLEPPAAAASRRRYSPITAQRKPIMMKKPLKSAMSPRPP